ncbi:MAG: exo-beta-N-acetylmuramidase NamZ family protein [bacterium]
MNYTAALRVTLVSFCCLLFAVAAQAQVKPGIEVLLTEKMDLIRGKRVGLITNPTGVTSQLVSTIDALHAYPEVKLVALFGPEHGVRGDVFAGQLVDDFVDARTGVPVYSLYGKNRAPTAEMLKDVEVLIYDIQDIGSRAYTYIYTMALSMQAAAQQGLPFVVLDRPNPLGGELIEGPLLDERFKSFIGLYPIPYIYGLTTGELAKFLNEEFQFGANLTVVPMQGWQRKMLFEDTALPWVLTSPHVPHARTVFHIATAGCLGELSVVNEGVGYTLPFELLGQTWINGHELAETLNAKKLPGVIFRPLYFKPYYFSHKDQQLYGVQIHLTDPRAFRPMLTQLHVIATLMKLYPSVDLFDTDRVKNFDQAMGTDMIKLRLRRGVPPDSIYRTLEHDLKSYREKRVKYLMYE